MSDAIRIAKAHLRRQCNSKREDVAAEQVASYSARIREQILALPEWEAASVVHSYVESKSNEVETRPLIQLAIESGRRILVPLVSGTGTPPLLHTEISSLDELRPGPFGLLQPALSAALPEPICADLVIVPGLAFDRRGGRLGWGKGFYDDFLSRLEASRIGVAYSGQVVESVPMEAHDIYMDKVVTEMTTHHTRRETP